MSNQLIHDKLSIINNIIKNDKVSHAILLEVDNCDTCMPYIKNIIKLILCKNKNKDILNINCGKCNICNLIDGDNYPDLSIISTDGNWIKKQQLVDLQSDFNNKSLLNNKRIYVIKEAEKLNVSSSNSLLKFLEDPEDDIVAILVTTNKYLLLDTILSRCQTFSLKESDYILDSSLLDKVELFIEYLLMKKNLFIDYKYLLDNIFIDKNNTKKLLNEVEKYFLLYLVNDKYQLNNSFIYKKMKNIALTDIILYVNIIEQEKQKLEYNVNYKIWVDNLFSRIIGDVYG